jgi:RNA polymerase sigma factor (sigma-70 family)
MSQAESSAVDLETLAALRDPARRRTKVEQLYVALAGRLRRYYARHGASAAEADDWCQETFVRIIRGVGEFRGGEGEFMPWIWTIARNVARDAYRRSSNRDTLDLDDLEAADEPADAAADTFATIERESEADCVRRAFQAFAQDHPSRADCLSWLATDRMDIAAIAGVLGRSAAATREYLSQCRKKLRPYLEPCLAGAHAP